VHYPPTYPKLNEKACIRRLEKRKIHKAYFVTLTFDSPTKAHFLPQTTCHHENIVLSLGNVLIRSSQIRHHSLHYPAPSRGYLRVPGGTDAKHELTQYREAHLVVGSTIHALDFKISLKKQKKK
jgi:hypothetical protein